MNIKSNFYIFYTGIFESIQSKAKESCTCSGSCWMSAVTSKVPILSWLPSYGLRASLMGDVVAGITVAIMHIPQGQCCHCPARNILYTRKKFDRQTFFNPGIVLICFKDGNLSSLCQRSCLPILPGRYGRGFPSCLGEVWEGLTILPARYGKGFPSCRTLFRVKGVEEWRKSSLDNNFPVLKYGIHNLWLAALDNLRGSDTSRQLWHQPATLTPTGNSDTSRQLQLGCDMFTNI